MKLFLIFIVCISFCTNLIAESKQTSTDDSAINSWSESIGLRLGISSQTSTTRVPLDNSKTNGLFKPNDYDENFHTTCLFVYQPGRYGLALKIANSSNSENRNNIDTQITLGSKSYQVMLGVEFRPFGQKRFAPTIKPFLGPTFSTYQYEIRFDGKSELKDQDEVFSAAGGVEVRVPIFKHFSAFMEYSLELERMELQKIKFDSKGTVIQLVSIGGYLEI